MLIPVNEEWQKEICRQLEIPFQKKSRKRTASNCHGLSHRCNYHPSGHTSIKGDGNCWYNALSYIITGSEDSAVLLKSKIRQFMDRNEQTMQQILDNHAHEHERSHDHLFAQQVRNYSSANNMPLNVQCLIAFHFDGSGNPWADHMIMDISRCFLKKDIRIYNKTYQQWQTNSSSTFWANIDSFEQLINHDYVPHPEGNLYIQFVNGNHFEVIHNGLYRKL